MSLGVVLVFSRDYLCKGYLQAVEYFLGVFKGAVVQYDVEDLSSYSWNVRQRGKTHDLEDQLLTSNLLRFIFLFVLLNRTFKHQATHRR